MPYTIGHFPGVKTKIHSLDEEAKERGIRKAYLDALTQITVSLRTRPLAWGDPEYTMNIEGGVVCHGIAHPVYVVPEPEQTVLIFDVQLLT